MNKPRIHPVPRVGDTVRFNRYGLEQVYGTDAGLEHMLVFVNMKITSVEGVSGHEPEHTFAVEVDNAGVNQFLLTHHYFDVVRPAKAS